MKLLLLVHFLTVFLFATSTPFRKTYNEIARRARADVGIHDRSYSDARFTYYGVGIGTCGVANVPSDLVVALNAYQFTKQLCFQQITISCNGQNVQAIITDECSGCPYAGLDLSLGLFTKFAPASVGILVGDWSFGFDGAPHPSAYLEDS